MAARNTQNSRAAAAAAEASNLQDTRATFLHTFQDIPAEESAPKPDPISPTPRLRTPQTQGPPIPEEFRPFKSPTSPFDDNNPFRREQTPNLAEAIMLMTQELRRRETPKTPKKKSKEPDTFDGSDSRKLTSFLAQCTLYFRNNPAFDDDDNKVSFALSYLRGTALEWFEPTLLGESDDDSVWLDDWSAFVHILRSEFGPIDPTGEAEDSLDHLRMRDNQKILRYNVDFKRLSARTQWDDGALRYRYYTGLAERIKDVLGTFPKPKTLAELKVMAHNIDARYWERQREKSRSSDKSTPKSDKSDKSDKKQTPASSSSNNNSSSSKPNSQQQQKSSSTSPKSALSDKLGKDGKLTPQERQRRFDNNLCMFCGNVGHRASDCSKKSSSNAKAKARAAQAEDKSEKTTESKK